MSARASIRRLTTSSTGELTAASTATSASTSASDRGALVDRGPHPPGLPNGAGDDQPRPRQRRGRPPAAREHADEQEERREPEQGHGRGDPVLLGALAGEVGPPAGDEAAAAREDL